VKGVPIRLWWNQKSQSLFAKQRGAIVPIRLWWNQKSTSRMPRFIPASLFQFDYDEIRRNAVGLVTLSGNLFQFDYGEIRRNFDKPLLHHCWLWQDPTTALNCVASHSRLGTSRWFQFNYDEIRSLCLRSLVSDGDEFQFDYDEIRRRKVVEMGHRALLFQFNYGGIRRF